METLTQTSQARSHDYKKTSLFLFFTLQIAFIEGCQISTSESKFSIDDAIRIKQSEQLLVTQENKDVIKEFTGDIFFSRYVSSYVKKQNKSLDAEKLTHSLMHISNNNGDDPVLLLALIKTESSFNQNAIGSVGEVGLMQIRPETAQWICEKNNIEWRGAAALKDPAYNILVGSHYFRYLKKSIKKPLPDLYINAYNSGLTAMRRSPSAKLKERDYFKKVIANYSHIYSELKKIKTRSTKASINQIASN